MIKIDGEKCFIEVEGEVKELVVEMTVIMHSLFWRIVHLMDEDDAKELFRECLENAFISDEEMAERMNDEIWNRMVGDE